MRGPRVETRGYSLTSLTGLTLRTADLRAELNPRAILGRPFGAASSEHNVAVSGLPIRRGSPLWLPIRFERGHVVAPGTALGTCPRSAPGVSNSVPSVANVFPQKSAGGPPGTGFPGTERSPRLL